MKVASPQQPHKPVLESVNRFLEIEASWHPVTPKGSTNCHYRSQVAEQNLILRINAKESLAFGVSRQSEARVLELIQGYRWAPKVINNNWQEGWCLMVDHGASVEASLPLTANHILTRSLLDSMHQWQSIRFAEGALFNYSSLFAAYRDEIQTTLNNTTQKEMLSLLDELDSRFNSLPAVPHCLTHHDLHPGNLCGSKQHYNKKEPLIVLDWEYAGFGNPWFDVAALTSTFHVQPEQISTLPAFSQLDEKQLKQGTIDAVWLATALERLWFYVRRNARTASNHSRRREFRET